MLLYFIRKFGLSRKIARTLFNDNWTIFCPVTVTNFGRRDSSVGVVTRYWMEGPVDRMPAGGGGGERFSAPVKTGPGTHPASYTMVNGYLSRG
jgi:hypothetical protein